jgi:hypothetical protein
MRHVNNIDENRLITDVPRRRGGGTQALADGPFWRFPKLVPMQAKSKRRAIDLFSACSGGSGRSATRNQISNLAMMLSRPPLWRFTARRSRG